MFEWPCRTDASTTASCVTAAAAAATCDATVSQCCCKGLRSTEVLQKGAHDWMLSRVLFSSNSLLAVEAKRDLRVPK